MAHSMSQAEHNKKIPVYNLNINIPIYDMCKWWVGIVTSDIGCYCVIFKQINQKLQYCQWQIIKRHGTFYNVDICRYVHIYIYITDHLNMCGNQEHHLIFVVKYKFLYVFFRWSSSSRW
jgi:hypothetical protein